MAATAARRKEATFTINGKEYKVDENIPVNTSLNTFIRNYAKLTGTKAMCLEGGCGACVVTVWHQDPVTKQKAPIAVNSCLFPVLACDGLAVTTIEGIGNKLDGYHRLQTRIMQLNATQCGFCTPGMVMNMYSLLEKGHLTMKEVENSFGGSICRCTGYRPILDAFKSFSSDVPEDLKKRCEDIEELYKIKICEKSGQPCSGKCGDSVKCDKLGSTLLHIEASEGEWFAASSISDILSIFDAIGDKTYMLVAGNTARGVYHRVNEPQVFININSVSELRSHSVGEEIILGANVTLTEAMELFYKLAKEQPKKFAYTKVLADHIDLIANVPVRNTGTIAGNLTIKYEHNEFPSDVFLILETAGATLTVVDKDNKEEVVTLPAYLNLNMKKKVLKNVKLPSLDESFRVGSFKIMPRAQNAHAYVNAGFRFKINSQGSGRTLAGKPTVVFGGINPSFLHASKTEEYLKDKNVLDQAVLQGALKQLEGELVPDHVLPDATPEYRKGLAKALLYKFIISLAPDSVKKNVKSGGPVLHRPVSSGKQEFETDKKEWPLNQPIPKVEALVQASGEAKYVNDAPHLPGELYAAFVLSSVGPATVEKINATDALNLPGVVAFYKAEDIPGKNAFTPPLAGLDEEEQILSPGNVKFAGEALGIVVAETQDIAVRASKLVKVDYKDVKKPVLTIREVLSSGDKSRIADKGKIDPTDPKAKSEAKHVIKGNFDIGGQYHFTMETQSCVCIPIEDGMDVYSATQWMDLTQFAISQALGIPENSINVYVRRLGGAYGAKISRATHVATACALAAYKLNRPVRMVLSIEDNMKSMGKRFSCVIDYEVGVDDNGVIKYMEATLYENAGYVFNESVVGFTIHHFVSCYDQSTWSVKARSVRTDLPSNTYCRAPGSTEGIVFIENIMEHIAKTLNKDPIQVRMNNLKKDSPIQKLTEELKQSSSYDERVLTIEEFNKENLWKKRGIAFVPMEYPFGFWGNFHAIVSIYAGDGTVAVAHGGIECGQGINTKVTQVCAHILGISLDLVSVKPSNNLTAPNGMVTGGSIASEACSYATMMACKELLKRLEPVKKTMDHPTWQQLIAEAYKQNVDLCATYMFTNKDDVKNYSIYGVTVAELEVDILTGQQQILRVDLIEDCGISLSPEIDVGQIEGAFVMGLGYYLIENLVYHPNNGELLTNRTWNYKTPGAKDIPIDFRIQFRRNAPNPTGVLRSKATGEPPLCMSCVVLFALRNALDSARKNAGKSEKWYKFDAPATTENIFLTGLPKADRYIL
ncbi:hypothetical protein R5R35_007242 [Gryllus longicercus]|uniref:Aldehyde oxidase n=1 Tax=Gryllus longicercus TaxID=2509291 RepID=A0AAN9VDQ0_9ORTH